MSGEIINVTDADFEAQVINADGPVLVDYWAPWCGPCKMVAPILEQLVGEYGDKLTIAKINIDDNPETPKKYGVRGIPTLTVFKNGNVEATKVGALSKSQLTAFLDNTSLNKAAPPYCGGHLIVAAPSMNNNGEIILFRQP